MIKLHQLFNAGRLIPAACLAAFWWSAHVNAQPSGGPYGPVDQRYELPDVPGTIYYVAPEGTSSSPGQDPNAPTSLEAAMTRVVTGDAILMRGGTYRTGHLLLNQGITIQPYLDEKPVLKGTRVASTTYSVCKG